LSRKAQYEKKIQGMGLSEKPNKTRLESHEPEDWVTEEGGKTK
jgi:hypothetical protein